MLWKKLLAPVLLAAALGTTAVSASAASAPSASGALEAQAAFPAQQAPTPDHVRITDPAVACQHQDLHVSLPPLCKLWASGSLTPAEKEAIGHIIVRVANVSIHHPNLKERLIARCERYLAAHPNDDGLIARLCRRIVAGETVTPEELRSLREAAPALNGKDGERKLRPAAQGTPAAPRPRPAVTATPTS